MDTATPDQAQNAPSVPISTITSPAPTSTAISGTHLTWNQVVFYDSDPANYDAKEGEDVTRISILRSQLEADQESKWIAPRNIHQVRSIDFSTSVAIIVYAGLEGENRYTMKIDALTKKDDTIFIYATIAGAPNGEIRNPVETSPYLVITLNKSDVPTPTKFTLIADCYSYSIKFAQKTIEITH